MTITLSHAQLSDGTRLSELRCSVSSTALMSPTEEIDQLFRMFAHRISRRQIDLMEAEYLDTVDCLEKWSEGKATSYRQISVETAVLAYRYQPPADRIENGYITISLPTASTLFTAQKVRGSRKAVYGKRRIALMSTVEPNLPSLEGELVGLKMDYLATLDTDNVAIESGANA